MGCGTEAVIRTPVTVTVRVTVSRGVERGGTWRRSAATTRAKPHGRGRWRRKSRVGGQGDDRHWTTGGEPLSVWKHGVREKEALGEKEVERQLHVPCDEPRFEEPRVEK